MELLLLVEERTGFTFEQGKFFDSPDISTLEKNLVEKPAAASIVALQPLGERPPLWCLHNELGVVMHYLSLARLLGHDVPVLGLQAATIAPDATEVTIEAMAEDYLDLIRQRQVSGPYFLCGNCFDGLLAFEIARLLVDEGESVEFLGLIETSMPTGPLRAALDTAKRSEHPLRTLCGIAWRQCRKALTSPPKQAADGSGQAGQEDVPTAEAPVDPLFTLANNRTSKMMKNAADRYRPKPYGGEINLFYTGEADAYEGWRRVARGGVTATPLPIKRDDHMPHLVLHPMVKDLAREFRSKLNLPSQPRREKD